MSRKEEILEAASRVIAMQGLNQLTLDAVALEARISKGGLLYHFRTKEELIKGMNELVIRRFQEAVRREYEREKNFSRAYLLATIKDLEDTEHLGLNTSLLATTIVQNDLLAQWKEAYEAFRQEFERENTNPALSLTIRLTCDGLWFTKMFGLDPLSAEDQRGVIDYLLGLLEEGQL